MLASLICIGANYSSLAGARGFCIDLIEVLRKTLNALFENDSMNVRLPPVRRVSSSRLTPLISCEARA